ncbi:ankycorbin isoform X2 [Thalassophryne amazonica]|uniref:ankycorbin isoform X2 n=1 Tax=Thalassophryne amazonica TaxID=390379 RepID=UPI0014717050|nr:ankycorbin isoform X2 [Thalassophryne amazonica]
MKSLKAKFRKTDVHEWNKNDERLLAAVEHGEVEKVASLLAKKGASAVKLDHEGKSALHAAAARGHTDCLSIFLSHGVEPSTTDAAGFSPLHLAAKNGHTECCKKLLQSKCCVDAIDGSGRTALHHAAVSGNVQTVQLLCEFKSPVNLKDTDGLTPLLLSAKHAHAEVCSSLLDYGAEINLCDNNGRTALMLAAEANAASVVDVLLQRGADLSAVDSQGHNVHHYAKLSGNSEVKTTLAAALSRQQVPDVKSPRSPQNSGPSSPSGVTSTGTPASTKSDSPKRIDCKEDEFRETVLKDQLERLQEEKNMLLETIEDLKHTVEQTPPGAEQDLKAEHSFKASSALISALQTKIAALTLENQQLANRLKKHPSLQGSDDLRETSRPDSMASNNSFHSTQDDFDSLTQVPSTAHVEREDGSGPGGRGDEEETEGGSKEEIKLLRQALENAQTKLLETKKENRSLQAQLKPEWNQEREDESVREKGREEELMESLAELQSKLTGAQERYHQAIEEAELFRLQIGRGGAGERENLVEKQEAQRCAALEKEVEELKEQLVRLGSEREAAVQQINQLEEALRRAEGERQSAKQKEQERTAQIEELYKEAQEEIRILQEALRGTVPVEAAAKDFEEMKAELNEVIAGLQRRLLELSHSYSETKSQLNAAQKQLSEARAERDPSSLPSTEQHAEMLQARVEELQTLLAQTEKKCCSAQDEISVLRLEVEVQAQSSVALSDHTQVVSSLGNAIKELENQAEALKEQLQQKTLQLEALQNRSPISPEDSVSRLEHEALREGLESEVSHLTQLLQEALRKQDEMALEAAEAWQKARDSRAERDGLQELLLSVEKEKQTLTCRLAESQDAVSQLKQLVENHVSSEREKNKKIDDLSREVGKLKDALNSLSQFSYTSGSSSKRQQQNQQLETMQQQIKQLQYQLAETKKQHHEIVSVYRMHLLYAVQGQMDEDVQNALKQILLMCKMPNQAKEAC